MERTVVRLFSLSCVGMWLTLALSAATNAERWSWQEPHANVRPRGDLEWAPKPFVFQKGESVRHIDYEHGDDSNDGLTRQTPWKHHPWDAGATGKARACTGIHTYVFRRGAVYRGSLTVTEPGEPGNPIRLTSDPAWGDGEAVICGSETVSGWKKGADHKDIPESEKVWYADLDFAPRCVWLVEEGGRVVRIPLARTPNWKVSNFDDIKSEWWYWDYPRKPFDVFTKTSKGKKLHLGIDTKHITKPAEYYQNALVWTEYGWVMGTPYPARVEVVDTQKKGLGFGGQWGGVGSKKIVRYCRYYLEDKPHYLDEAGEFWFDKQGQGGRLCIRLPGDQDPNAAHIEAAKHLNLIDSEGMGHVHITGLSFRFTNVYWGLDAGPWAGKDVDPACIRLLGSGRDIRVANCLFEHVNLPIRMKAVGKQDAIDQIAVCDSEFRYTDHGAIQIADGSDWGDVLPPMGRLYDVRVLRNRLLLIGRRPNRYGQGHALVVENAQTLEVAGNVLDRCYGAGVFLRGAKRSGATTDRPLSRMLVHHNRVIDSMLNTNDWGGIETWQGGPAYVYNNISGNPGGYQYWKHKLPGHRPGGFRFGHAYYLDGAFKNYHFNNIAWGKSKDPASPLGNTSAFQEIHSYQNTFFNNTVYNFVIGSRRQAPHAGRDKFLGNIWHGIGDWTFRHADPARTAADANVADAGKQKSHFAYETNAYTCNVLYDISDKVGVFEASGRWHKSFGAFQKALAKRKSLTSDIGEVASRSSLRDPVDHDFRLAARSAAIDKGVKVFVPWGLYAMVAEWNFYPTNQDPTRIMDEHWYMTPYHVKRDDYYKRPMYPLKTVNIRDDDYARGPLEDWIDGALTLNGKDQYAILRNDQLTKPLTHRAQHKPPNWMTATIPTQIVPGRPFQAKVQLHDVAAGQKLHADLHWSKTNGKFAGTNAWGGPPKEISGEGPYTFTLKPKDKPDLGSFTLTVFVTTAGQWKDHSLIARITIPKSDAGAATGIDTKTVTVGGDKVTKKLTVKGEDLKSPQIHTTSFLIEAYFKTEPGHTGGVLIEKMREAGYALTVNKRGGVTFSVKGAGTSAHLASHARVNDGHWHHIIAEADRESKTLTLYADGKEDATGSGVGAGVSLANSADLHVGGTPEGRCLEGSFDFLRIALGTLADAKTTIEELYAWQFDGPFLRDFTGRPPADGKRDAGALEFSDAGGLPEEPVRRHRPR